MKDNFSIQAHGYRQFRPGYPGELFDFILDHVQEKSRAWDCGTGNGQFAVELARSFKHVVGTDMSNRQIANAIPAANIDYKVMSAEETTFPAQCFDLVTVAQAVHWFHFGKFYKEVKRVVKPGGVIALAGYGIPRMTKPLQKIIDHFYHHITGPYWDEERKFIDDRYNSVPFPFSEIPTPDFVSTCAWDQEQLTGFLNTWSAVQHFKKIKKKNPVEEIVPDLQAKWPAIPTISVSFPVFLRMGVVND